MRTATIAAARQLEAALAAARLFAQHRQGCVESERSCACGLSQTIRRLDDSTRMFKQAMNDEYAGASLG